MEQMRLSCAPLTGHGHHPRVAVFSRLACLSNDDDKPWPPMQENCYMQLVSWMRIATDEPMKSDRKLTFTERDMRKLVDNLLRLYLIPREAKSYYTDLGCSLKRSPEPSPPSSPTRNRPQTTPAADHAAAASQTTHRSPSPPRSPGDSVDGGTPKKGGKIDVDELIYTWMACWGGWQDEVMKPGYVIDQ